MQNIIDKLSEIEEETASISRAAEPEKKKAEEEMKKKTAEYDERLKKETDERIKEIADELCHEAEAEISKQEEATKKEINRIEAEYNDKRGELSQKIFERITGAQSLCL